MVFGFFSRKSGPVVDAGSSTPAPTATTDNDSALKHFQFPPKQQHTPSPSIDSSSSQLKEKKDPSPAGSDLLPPSGPVDTPSPGLCADDNADQGHEADDAPDPAVLLALIASVPPQTLHAYTLAHLSPVAPSPFPFANPAAGLILHKPPTPPSARTLSVLTEFFSNLAPPPKLHCVRCHKDYFELENTDRSCLVPHDDDSAIVDRVRTGLGTELETLWGCCGRTVDGDGDQGPPDGWCYEGRHSTDLKRARFRADSTPHNDKLVSCAQLRCGEPPLPRRGSNRVSRKRARVDSMHADDAEDTPSISSSAHSRGASKGHGKTASIASSSKEKAGEGGDKPRPAKRPRSRKPSVSFIAPGDAMEVDDGDTLNSPPVFNVPPSPPKSPRRPPPSSTSTSNTGKTRVKPKPMPSSPKPRSKGSAPGTTVPLQRSPLSSSFTAPPSPSQKSSTSRPTTPSKKGTKVEVEIVKKSPSIVSLSGGGANKRVAKKGSESSLKDKDDPMVLKSASDAGSKKVVRRGMKAKSKSKIVGEIVETSVDGEAEWV